jgi:hypothetical protein
MNWKMLGSRKCDGITQKANELVAGEMSDREWFKQQNCDLEAVNAKLQQEIAELTSQTVYEMVKVFRLI